MKKLSKMTMAAAALAIAMLAAPLMATSASAAPAGTTSDLMRALQSSNNSGLELVHSRRHWHRHGRRHHCRWVRRCWGHRHHRHCRWVRRCW